MRLGTLLVVLLALGCDSGKSCADQPAPLPQCVPGQYQHQIVTDPPAGSCIDPRCWPPMLPEPGQPCKYPGLACEYFGRTLGCDCNGVSRCLQASSPGCPDGGV